MHDILKKLNKKRELSVDGRGKKRRESQKKGEKHNNRLHSEADKHIRLYSP